MSCLTWSSLHNNIKQLVRAEWERCCLVDWQGKGPGNPIITVPSTVEEIVPGARGPVSVSVPVGLSKRTEELQTVRRMLPWTIWSTNSRSHCSSREEGPENEPRMSPFPNTTRRKTHRLPTVGCRKAVVPEEASALSSMTTTREGGHLKRIQDTQLRVILSRDHNFNNRREEVFQDKEMALHVVTHKTSICTHLLL